MTSAGTTLDHWPDSAPTGRYVQFIMGVPISLALQGRHTDDDAAQAAWAGVVEQLHEVDQIFSTYLPESFTSRLDRGEITVADCPPEVAEVLALGDRAERESAGAFRIRRPDIDGHLRLDPSGVVKGWAVERAATLLEALPDTDFCLSAGGDMTCRTLDPTGQPWRIGIEDPADPHRIIAVVPVFTGAVATSGSAHRGPHLRDARTNTVPAGVASVTVVARSLTWADIDATAAYVQGPEAARWLDSRPGRTGFVVWSNGTTSTTGQAWPVDEMASPLPVRRFF